MAWRANISLAEAECFAAAVLKREGTSVISPTSLRKRGAENSELYECIYFINKDLNMRKPSYYLRLNVVVFLMMTLSLRNNVFQAVFTSRVQQFISPAETEVFDYMYYPRFIFPRRSCRV